MIKSTEYYISLLIKHSRSDIHLLACYILRSKSIYEYIPLIVDIMIKHDSDAIYELLKLKAKNMKCRIILYFYLKTQLLKTNINQILKCYYLLIEINNISYYYNYKSNSNYYKHRFVNNRMIIKHLNLRSKNIKNMLLSFVKHILPVSEITNRIDFLTSPYTNKKTTIKNNQYLNNSLMFYNKLIGICGRLNDVPKYLQNRFLVVQLELININLNNKDYYDLLTGDKIVYIHSNTCKCMCSRDNNPYLLNLVTKKSNIKSNITYKNNLTKQEIKKLNSMFDHFEVIKTFNDIGDINGIRLNMIEVMEELLVRNIINSYFSNEMILKNNINEKVIINEDTSYERLDKVNLNNKELETLLNNNFELDENFYEERMQWHINNYDSVYNPESNLKFPSQLDQ
ncbi:hypothetical protein HERIO_1028 [Hepatospora eriocheir]|nr:hypothetical protein HERIO_1028 [Hepatospora eriocheir]